MSRIALTFAMVSSSCLRQAAVDGWRGDRIREDGDFWRLPEVEGGDGRATDPMLSVTH